VGRLAGDRQSGGWFFAGRGLVGPHTGRGRRGGEFVLFDPSAGSRVAGAEADVLQAVLRDAAPWL
jgi:hypothetical protein